MYNFDVEMPETIAEAVEALTREDAQPLSGGQTSDPYAKGAVGRTFRSGFAERDCRDEGRLDKRKWAALYRWRDNSCYRGRTKPRLLIRRWRPLRRGSVILPSATVAPSAALSRITTLRRATLRLYLGSGATIVTDTREIAADDYFLGMFDTALEEDEIVTEVRFPIPEAAHYEKHLQPASRFPLVAVYVAKFNDRVRVAVTGASENGVFRWTEAEAALNAQLRCRINCGPGGGRVQDDQRCARYRRHTARIWWV